MCLNFLVSSYILHFFCSDSGSIFHHCKCDKDVLMLHVADNLGLNLKPNLLQNLDATGR